MQIFLTLKKSFKQYLDRLMYGIHFGPDILTETIKTIMTVAKFWHP